MVGFHLHTGTDRTARHFYVVQNAEDEHDARRRAARLADSPAEREAREHALLDATWTEVALLHHDGLGNWRLSAHRARAGAHAPVRPSADVPTCARW